MTKKIRIDVVIFLIIASILLSVLTTAYIINNRISSLTKVQSVYSKLTHIDEIVSENYIGSIDSERLSDEIAKGYMTGLVDNYSQYYTKEEYKAYMDSISGEFEGIGMQTAYNAETNETFISSVSVGSPAGNAGLRVGDRIISVNDTLAMNSTYEKISELLRLPLGSTATITVIRKGDERTCTVTAMEFKQNTVYSTIMGYVGYISISSFNDLTPENFSEAVDSLIDQGARNLIIDVRNNPGGSIDSVVGCVDKIVATGTVATAVYKRSEGEDSSTAKVVYEALTAQETDIPIVVLCNKSTASGGELFAAALADFGKATVVGTTTYGKGTGQSFYKLPDGSYIKLTDMTYFPPSGASFNMIGVTPGVEVELKGTQNDITLLGENYIDDPYIIKAFETLAVDPGILETITR